MFVIFPLKIAIYGGKISVLGRILHFPPNLRSALGRLKMFLTRSYYNLEYRRTRSRYREDWWVFRVGGCSALGQAIIRHSQEAICPLNWTLHWTLHWTQTKQCPCYTGYVNQLKDYIHILLNDLGGIFT